MSLASRSRIWPIEEQGWPIEIRGCPIEVHTFPELDMELQVVNSEVWSVDVWGKVSLSGGFL